MPPWAEVAQSISWAAITRFKASPARVAFSISIVTESLLSMTAHRDTLLRGTVVRSVVCQPVRSHMNTIPTIEALQQHIAALEAELAQLRPLEAAAREAYAFFVGRRPGFPSTYARDVLLAAFEPNTTRPRNSRSKPTRSVKRRKQP